MGRRKKQRTVSASTLSQMGVCERLVVFEHRAGKRLTASQKVALQRGLQAHQRFALEGLMQGSSTGRSFIDTKVFAERLEAWVLRCLRDRILRRTPGGRLPGHYRCTLAASPLMNGWSLLRGIVQAMSKPIALLFSRFASALGNGNVD